MLDQCQYYQSLGLLQTINMRVLLHTETSLLGYGFAQFLSTRPGLEPFVVSGGFDELTGAIERIRPEVALVDVNDDVECSDLLHLVERYPQTRLVLWVQSVSLEFGHNAKEIGVRGILRKNVSMDLLVRCLEKIAEGELWYDRTLLNSLLGSKQVRLSPRERQLLTLISQGLSNKQLAVALSIAEGTVKVYLSKLFHKVGVSDRFELALYGLRNRGLGINQVPDSRAGWWTATNLLVVPSAGSSNGRSS